MATAHMPDEFFDAVAHHLPPERPVGPMGGRPRVGHRVVVRVIWFVLTTGARWEDVPAELGCSGRTAHRRLRVWEEAGIWDRLHADLLRLLKKEGKLGFWRWFLMALSIAGAYGRNDSVDVTYTLAGSRRVATGLDILSESDAC